MTRGRFISLEGIEGVGKTSNLAHVRETLERRGLKVVVTREPGGTPAAEQIREFLLSHGDEPIDETSEVLLIFAARALHVQNLIRPALANGEWVLCDRFTDATMAYQCAGRGFSEARVRRLAGWVHGDLWPDLTLLLDAPVEVGLARAAKRGAPDRFESENSRFFGRVRDGYLRIAAAEPGRVKRIDATRPLDSVRSAIDAILMPWIDKKD